MPRKLRVEYAGAIYHVINRGNYRTWVFESEGARKAFEDCLWMTCRRCGWVLHAYVLMGNHYHLAVETPEPNLSVGMHWLEATFANRFNRFRGEKGHVFQGRYKALLVEPGTAGLGRLCDYINLNPCRAGLCDVAGLARYEGSLYKYLFEPQRREPFMSPQTGLQYAGIMSDTAPGWEAYARHLQSRLTAQGVTADEEGTSLSEGWAIGSEAFRASMSLKHQPVQTARFAGAASAREAMELQWQARLDACLAVLRPEERRDKCKSAVWKIAVAASMKQHSSVSNGWLAARLGMGTGKYVCRLVGDDQYLAKIEVDMRERLSVIWAT